MKILAIQNRMGIGDTVIFLPFVKAISKQFDTPVSLLVKENSKATEFLNQTSYIDKIIHLKRNNKIKQKHDGFIGIFKLASDIKKYNIGYCSYGDYKNHIIIPSYSENGELNYFTARSFEINPYNKYKNPDTSRDIIPFELFINWNLPIVLCEGPFDAIAIKRNSIPLLGKNIQNSLMKKIVTSTVTKIYIALDQDAMKQSLKFCEQLLNIGKEVYLVVLPGKDPSEMGFEFFTKLIQTTQPLTQYKLMEKKLSLI